MALNIKDPLTEQLVAELAAVTGESKTEAVRVAVTERKARLEAQHVTQGRRDRLRRFLTEEAWPQIPPEAKGKRLTRAEREQILGYGPEGV